MCTRSRLTRYASAVFVEQFVNKAVSAIERQSELKVAISVDILVEQSIRIMFDKFHGRN